MKYTLRLSKLLLWFGFNIIILIYLASAFKVRIPILCFHEILMKPSKNPLAWQRDRLEFWIKRLKSAGYRFILPGDLITLKEYINQKQIILTFDDGTLDHYQTVIPLLNEFEVKAIFFWITSEIKKLNPMQRYLLVKKLGESKFGSHTTQWRSMLPMNNEQRQREIDDSVEFLEGFSKQKIEHFAFPSGEYDDSLAIMILQRFKYVFSVDLEYFWPGRHQIHGRYMVDINTTDANIEEYLARAKPFLQWDFWLLALSWVFLNILLILRKTK